MLVSARQQIHVRTSSGISHPSTGSLASKKMLFGGSQCLHSTKNCFILGASSSGKEVLFPKKGVHITGKQKTVSLKSKMKKERETDKKTERNHEADSMQEWLHRVACCEIAAPSFYGTGDRQCKKRGARRCWRSMLCWEGM